ncbi:MAG: hypothetical protein HFF62_14335 [Oscillospiraceae bacterium]|jgi:hypothetical protein|nr:hypothetical protein [Oscillospiraceae bacterium]
MLAGEQAERDRLAAALREALAYATPTQARGVCAYYLGGLTQQQTLTMSASKTATCASPSAGERM